MKSPRAAVFPLFASTSLAVLTAAGAASAGTITSVGAVTPLTSTSQLIDVVGNGNFNEGPTSGNVPLNSYSGQGLTFRTGSLTSLLPGVTTPGTATAPTYSTLGSFFPAPSGGGSQTGAYGQYAGVATFTGTITQVGLTASMNGTQYLTVWNKSGAMIGQVKWEPGGTSGFVGIDTIGTPIGMVAYGNDDLWAGATYDIGGSTIMSDSWVWASGTCTTDAHCDDGNVCTTNTCVAGKCVFPNNTVACDDGNACTQVDTCTAGVCVGTNPVICTALDQCHTAGTCNTATGVCSSPTKANGSACSDGNGCTQTDTCQAGACVGANPVVCTASDQCHSAGTCDATTGVCSAPSKADGTACNDGNACTTADTCQSGACTGASPVLCSASDQCHAAGTCNPTSGVCSNPAKVDGSACTDGNGCTTIDTCVSGVCVGGSPVTCSASDGCHVAGVCDPTSGMCSNPSKPDGSACSDTNACTRTDTCVAGVCTGTNPVVCAPIDQCHTAGTCDATTGMCTNVAKADGTACDDSNACTATDTCQAGVCTGASPKTCTASDACHDVGTCDPMTGACSNPSKMDGASCDDSNECTQPDGCQSGVCKGTAKADGEPCGDGGVCAGGTCGPAPDAGTDAGDAGEETTDAATDSETDAATDTADTATEADANIPAATTDSSGCGCRTATSRGVDGAGLLALLGLVGAVARKRRRA